MSADDPVTDVEVVNRLFDDYVARAFAVENPVGRKSLGREVDGGVALRFHEGQFSNGAAVDLDNELTQSVVGVPLQAHHEHRLRCVNELNDVAHAFGCYGDWL